MTAEPDLLPLPDPTGNQIVMRGDDFQGDYNYYVSAFTGDQLESYARACVSSATASKEAEIEALRAEVEMLRDAFSDEDMTAGAHWFGRYVEQKRRAERLAEALDIIARVGKASRNKTTRTRWIVARAISALNGDEDWQALTKPKGFHDALLHPTAAQENEDA